MYLRAYVSHATWAWTEDAHAKTGDFRSENDLLDALVTRSMFNLIDPFTP